MKILKYLVFIGIINWSCGSSGGSGDTPAPEENKAPEAVGALVYPTDNLLCIDNTLNFQWSASTDPNGDNVNYILEIADNNQFTSAEVFNVNGLTKTLTLEKAKSFYWRVQAQDSKNLKSPYSMVYKFYTEGVGEVNHIPFSPELVFPNNSANLSETSITLKWNGSDVDGDILSYDVFLDTNPTPSTKIGNNLNEKSLQVHLSANATYFWKVIMKDNNGGESIGSTWSFKTE